MHFVLGHQYIQIRRKQRDSQIWFEYWDSSLPLNEVWPLLPKLFKKKFNLVCKPLREMICQILQGVRSEESYLCKCKQCFFFYKTYKMSNRYWFVHEIPFLYRQSTVIKSTTGLIAINTYNVLSIFTLFTSKKTILLFPYIFMNSRIQRNHEL